MRMNPNATSGRRGSQSGFSLIELMIALILGLLVAAAAGGVFISNKRVYASTETIGRIQENTRVAFELMSRDIREAGGNPCSASATLVNQLEPGGNDWWAAYSNGLGGYEGDDDAPGTTTGTGAAQRVDGTDAIDIHVARDADIRVTDHAQPSAVISVTGVTGVSDGDILMICNMDFAFVFQATGTPAGSSIQHNGGTSLNCSQEFQFERPDVACPGPGASADAGYCFVQGATPSAQCDEGSDSPAFIAFVSTTRWYVGNNANGGTSLYRVAVVDSDDDATPEAVGDPVEVVEGVEDMQIEYLEAAAGDYAVADAGTDWPRVIAARVRITLTGTEGALEGGEIEGTDGEVLDRVLTNVVTLRNREGLL